MSPLDWLRSRTKRQPHATGGIVAGPGTGDQTLAFIDTSCTLLMPTTPPTLPPGVTVTPHPDTTPTPDLIQQMAQALGGDVRTKPTEAAELPQRVPPSRERTAEITRQAEQRARDEIELVNCTCLAIYSNCRCKTRTR